MIVIRLQRVGRRNDPQFRLVVQERQKSAKSGKVIEVLGWHDPVLHKREFKAQRIKHWLSGGALASDTVHNLLVDEKIIAGPKKDVAPPSRKATEGEAASPKKKEEPAAEPKKEEEAAPTLQSVSTEAPEVGVPTSPTEGSGSVGIA